MRTRVCHNARNSLCTEAPFEVDSETNGDLRGVLVFTSLFTHSQLHATVAKNAVGHHARKEITCRLFPRAWGT